MDRELMQQALHTLEGWANYGKWVWPESALEQAKRNTTESIAALRERLAQPEQEPVAWYFVRDLEKGISFAPDNDATKSWQPLYPAFPAATEPVAWMVYTLDGKSVCVTDNPNDFTDQHKALPLYTAPRQWQGLTADEIWKCNKAKSGSAVEFHICYEHQNVEDFAKSIEAKLKEKNHG